MTSKPINQETTQQPEESSQNFSWYYYNQGEALAQQGKRQAAIQAYRRGIQINPKSAWSHYKLGQVLAQEEDWEEAIKSYSLAIELNPDFYEFYDGLGEVLLKQDRFLEAVNCFRKAVELEPNLSWCQKRLTEALAQQNSLNSVQERLSPLEATKRVLDTFNLKNLEDFLKSEKTLIFPQIEQPKVSIIIILYNRAELTLCCLKSILDNPFNSIELVIVDNGSTDKTRLLLERVKGANVILNQENKHFLLACNQAAQAAQGDFILFLNNDAQIIKNSLEVAVETLNSSPEIGAVGGQIILPDGTLQEAGSIIWQDGSCQGYGRGDSPTEPQYMFQRSVDYCSGAFLLTHRQLFLEFGGFDQAYQPAYYEETDYCVRLHKLGKKIIYHPNVSILHYEFASSTSSQAAIELQRRNQQLFIEKHQDWLQNQYSRSEQNILAARTTQDTGKRLLLIEDRVPHVFLGAGYTRCNRIVSAIVEQGYAVTIYSMTSGISEEHPLEEWSEVYADISRDIEVIIGYGWPKLVEFLTARQGYYDLVWVSRPHNMKTIAQDILSQGNLLDHAKIIYDAEAVYAERELEQKRLNGEYLSSQAQQQLIEAELKLAEKSDWIISVSQQEQQKFLDYGYSQVSIIGHSLTINPTPNPFNHRSNILFVGSIHELNSPNGDSVQWLIQEIFPQIKQKLKPPINLLIAGTNTAEELKQIVHQSGDPSIQMLGRVEDLTESYNQSRIFVAPTRFAAGIPHKVHEAAAYGIPVVTTSLIGKQLGWRHNQEILIADSAEEFAQQSVRLYTDQELWNRLRINALKRVEKDCSPQLFSTTIQSVLSQLSQEISPKFETGIAGLQRGIRWDEKNWELYFKLGDAWQAENKIEDAISAYRKAMKLNPNFHWTYYHLGVLLGKIEQTDEAIHCYQKAVEIDPEFAAAHHYLGFALYAKKQDYEGAIHHFQQALKWVPNSASVYQHLGDAFSAKQQWNEAVSQYQKAINLEPNLVEAYDHLGLAFAQLQQWEEATQAYQQAVQLNPDLSTIYYPWKELLQEQDIQANFEAAYQCYSQATHLSPEETSHRLSHNPEFYLSLGNAAAHQQQFQQAIMFYEQGLRIQSDHPLLAWQRQNTQALLNQEFAYPIEMVEQIRLKEPRILEKPAYKLNLRLQTSSTPILSIIIPVYNQILYTYNCLRSIAKTLDETLPFEVIVVDDHSQDKTQAILAQVSGIQVIYNSENLGFIGSCNRGAEQAKGQYIVFLNNDTVVLPKCFQEMLQTFKTVPQTGLVGVKLLYPHGKLQEAGGIVWQDGAAWNYGRNDHPNKPEYCYTREVDYCSGACIMLPKLLFEQLGRFDSIYQPAYYEDTDLAFKVRQAGYKVIYQPLAQVVHFEGISSGTDVNQGVKQYQIVNSNKFYQRWSGILKQHKPNGIEPQLEKERTIQKRLLMIDAAVLTPDQDSGSVTALNLIKIFQELSYKVTFVADHLLMYAEKYTADLQRIGVECLYRPHVPSIQAYLQTNGHLYDLIYMSRLAVAERHIDDLKKYAPQAKIIYDTVDLHYVREMRKAKLSNHLELYQQAVQTKKRELGVMEKADCTLVVSTVEKQLLEREAPHLQNVEFFHMPREIYGVKQGFENRKNIVFIGGFGHPPNQDAILYFVQDVFPLIHQKIEEIKLIIIGSHPPQNILDLASEQVIVKGYVEDISEYFNLCRLSIAPLRYGAGVKGKILTSMSYGLPIIATSIAVEGMELQDGYDILVGDTAHNFAEKVIQLYSNSELWNTISQNCLDTVSSRYSMSAVKAWFSQRFKNLELKKE